ncbi:phosphoacetylglucosamine mutase [Enteropsectra breve]|nr:phosphoacetylglucosamine mutase [Enteropsectra breve]
MRIQQKGVHNHNLKRPGAAAYYGTAGYRLNTGDLNNVLCRASVIAYIRSATFAGKYIGLYITASHNPPDYNGLKFVDYNGNMLDESWEINSDELVNAADNDFKQVINKIFRQNSNYSNMQDSIYGNVIIGRDTRDTGDSLTKNIKEVLGTYRCNVFDYGVVSCPEMHYLIRKCNEAGQIVEKSLYVENLHEKYTELKALSGNDVATGIDTANGVAGVKINELLEIDGEMNIEVLNNPETGILNKDCGADYVKTHKSAPKVREGKHRLTASFDGDVDRLIFYENSGKIFDGDAQAVFLAEYIGNELEKEQINCSIGVILSFYSNMGAVEYLQNKTKVVFAQTGVKNFVKEAKNFDIGIYFEPNGHGSVHFSRKTLEIFSSKNCAILKLLSEMFDPCIGDALANYLIFKALIKGPESFGGYKENFIRLLTVRIKDKNIIKVDSQNNVMSPDIQKDISQIAMSYKGRAFVRPSGTEDLVRVFAECASELQCDKMALNVAQIVYDSCEGIGPQPEIKYKK